MVISVLFKLTDQDPAVQRRWVRSGEGARRRALSHPSPANLPVRCAAGIGTLRRDRRLSSFHTVTLGGCLLDAGDGREIRLEADDVAILPHGVPHSVRALSTAAGSALSMWVDGRLHDEIVVKSNVDGEPDTKLICGRLISSRLTTTWCWRRCLRSW
jgi:mannose-6-phosphate isomerase-like protein (cupin superfamily)